MICPDNERNWRYKTMKKRVFALLMVLAVGGVVFVLLRRRKASE